MSRYILAVDQSTQGTKGLLFDEGGALVARADRPHRQIISPEGWVSHDPMEIRANTLAVCRDVVEKAGIDKGDIVGLGLSNQRRPRGLGPGTPGESVCDAIVWQCARATAFCEERQAWAERVQQRTGIPLSPYFPAAKMGWILEHVPKAKQLAREGKLALGTVDSWLVYFLSQDHPHKTDYSNASRTQLFDIHRLCWDQELCDAFGVPMEALPEVCMSDSCFGLTDLGAIWSNPSPSTGCWGTATEPSSARTAGSPARSRPPTAPAPR